METFKYHSVVLQVPARPPLQNPAQCIVFALCLHFATHCKHHAMCLQRVCTLHGVCNVLLLTTLTGSLCFRCRGTSDLSGWHPHPEPCQLGCRGQRSCCTGSCPLAAISTLSISCTGFLKVCVHQCDQRCSCVSSWTGISPLQLFGLKAGRYTFIVVIQTPLPHKIHLLISHFLPCRTWSRITKGISAGKGPS